MRRRVVVTGYGVVNPFGCDVEVMWKALLASRSAVGPITLFDATHYPTKIAAEVRNYPI
ncbi:MAG: beta-ketoacyl synthase N-terminal-like domain-containing protein, partial [Pirellulaceae bacterium]